MVVDTEGTGEESRGEAGLEDVRVVSDMGLGSGDLKVRCRTGSG